MIVIEAGVDLVANEDEFCDWLRSFEIVPEDTYRVVIDGFEITALCYARNAAGVKYVCKDPKDLNYREAVSKAPIKIMFDGNLPECLGAVA